MRMRSDDQAELQKWWGFMQAIGNNAWRSDESLRYWESRSPSAVENAQHVEGLTASSHSSQLVALLRKTGAVRYTNGQLAIP